MSGKEEFCLNLFNPLNNETVTTAFIANGSKMLQSLHDSVVEDGFLNESGPSLRTPILQFFGGTGMHSGA
jgi:hypothetical protein